MRPRELLAESWRNIASGASRPLALASLLVVILLVGVAFAMVQAANATSTYRSYLTGGAATTIVVAPGGIDAGRCAALAKVDGVTGAFALRQLPEEAVLAVLPSFGQPQLELVGDIVGMLGGSPSSAPGVFLSEQLAGQLGAHAGDPLPLRDGETRVSGVFAYPADGRQQFLADVVVVPVSATAQPFDQCWVTVWPPRDEFRSLLSTVLASTGQDAGAAEFQSLNPSLGTPRTLDELIDESRAQLLQLGAICAAAILGFAWVRTRRLDLAMALHLGQSRGAMTVQVLLEATVVAVITTLVVLVPTIIMLSLRTPPEDFAPLAADTALAALATVACVGVGALVGAATIRERSLSDWAKDR